MKSMEEKTKAENTIMPSSTFSDQIPTSFPTIPNIYDIPISSIATASSSVESLNFLDMLTVPDYPRLSIYDMVFHHPPTKFESFPQLHPPPPPPPPPPPASDNNNYNDGPPESCEVVNTPATPNSSSISTTSSEALNEDQQHNKTVQVDGEQEEQDQDKAKKQ